MPKSPHEHAFILSSSTTPRGYLGELYLRLYAERELDRLKAARRQACKMEASEVRYSSVLTSPNPNTNTSL